MATDATNTDTGGRTRVLYNAQADGIVIEIRVPAKARLHWLETHNGWFPSPEEAAEYRRECLAAAVENRRRQYEESRTALDRFERAVATGLIAPFNIDRTPAEGS